MAAMPLWGTGIGELWERQAEPGCWVVAAGALVALVLVADARAWRSSRTVVTIVHEGGHALVALATGRTLTGIRLHADASGVLVSRGRPRGPGMVFTTLAGYLAPPLLGLGLAVLVAAGRITLMLWLALMLLAGMLVTIRSLFGVLSVVTTGAIVFTVWWFADSEIRAAFAYFGVSFLLLAGFRPIVELQRLRSRRQAPDSDADQLARLTGVPGGVWVFLFGLVALGSLALGGWLLVPERGPLH